MFSTLLTVALFAAATIRGVAADDFAISTPGDTVQCKEIDLSWSGGQAPFNLIVVPSSDPCADAVQDLGDITGWTTKWTPKIPAGQQVTLSLLDTTGAEAWSGSISITAGDNSCVPADLAAAAAAAAAKPPVTVTPPTTGSTAANVTNPNPPSSSSPSSNTPKVGPVGAVGNEPLTGSSNGASHQAAPVMLLGAFAAIAALIL